MTDGPGNNRQEDAISPQGTTRSGTSASADVSAPLRAQGGTIPRAGGSEGGGRGHWEPGSAWALVRLVAVVGVGLYFAHWAGDLKGVLVILAILGMIVLHEAGHLAVAKWAGMKVTDFFVGFGPTLWSIKRHETRYGIKALPLGGFVRIAGMSNLDVGHDEDDEPRTYRQASFPRRVAVSSAGSAVHFILAFVMLWSLLALVGVPTPSGTVAIGGFVPLAGVANPAQASGLRKGDVIVGVDGHVLSGAQGPERFVAALHSSADKPVYLAVRRGGRIVHLVVTPANVRLHTEQGSPPMPKAGPPVGGIGVMVSEPTVLHRLGPFAALAKSGAGIVHISGVALVGLAHNFSPQGIAGYVHQIAPAAHGGHPPPSSSRLTSPIGIGRLAVQAADAGIGPVLMLLLELNVFIGLFNMVPLLPLDGGQVAVAIYERLRSKKDRPYHADVAKLLPAAYAVILIMVVMGVTAAYLDITRPMPNPF